MKIKKFLYLIFPVLIMCCFNFFACSKPVDDQQPEYLKETEYLEIINICQKYKEDEYFKITSNCGYYYEKTNDNIDVFIVVPAQISTWSGEIKYDVLLSINGETYQYNLYLSGYYTSNKNIDKINKAVEIYLLKNYSKSYTPEQIDRGLRTILS